MHADHPSRLLSQSTLDERGVCRTLSGLSAWSRCDETCYQRRRRALSCPRSRIVACFVETENRTEPLGCYKPAGTTRLENERCRCVPPLFTSPELPSSFGVAVLTSGESRSFLSGAVQASFRNMLATSLHEHYPVLLAVLTTGSSCAAILKGTCAIPGATQHTTIELEAALRSFNVAYRARYLIGGALPGKSICCSSSALRAIFEPRGGPGLSFHRHGNLLPSLPA